MTDLDVSMRLRLVNQLSRPAEEAERDLKELQKAAERLGRSKTGDMSTPLEKTGRAAAEAKSRIGALGKEADELRQKLGRVDDGAFDGLKADARAAEQAINRVGQAAIETKQKLRQINVAGGSAGGRPPSGVPHKAAGQGASAVEGFVDRFGVPIALGTGLGYMAGGAAGGVAVVAGAAVNAAAGDEQRSDALRVTGQYSAEEQANIDAALAKVGARRGVGTSGAQDVFGALQAGGLSNADASAMTDPAVVFSKATQADPTDAANLTIALRNNMGIAAENMMSAYDAIAVGGKAGQFEIPDMAKSFPSILAALGAQGTKGMDGVRLATALAQSIRKTTGTSDQAATVFEAMLTDMVSPDVVERASGYGIDVFGTKEKATKAGKDPVIALLNEYRGKIGGDERKMRDVFRNATAYQGYDAVFKDLDQLGPTMDGMKNASGTILNDYGIATDNFNSQKDILTSQAAKRVKDVASPILPTLTKVTKDAAAALERSDEAQIRQNQIDAMVKLIPNGAGKPKGPSSLKRFLLGAGADEGFSLKDHLGIDLKPTAEDSMQGYNEGLAAEGEKAAAEAQSIADRIRAMLGFTVSPTITPTFTPPAAAPAPAGEKHSSLQNSSNVRLTQNISAPNPKLAGIRSRREQARAIQQAQARSLYDLGSRPA